MWVLLQPGDTAVVPTPATRSTSSRRCLAGASVVAMRGGGRRSRTIEDPDAHAAPPLGVIVSFPHNPTTASVDLGRHPTAGRLRPRERRSPRARLRVCRSRLRRPRPPSVLQADGRRRLRDRALLPHEVVLDGRMAHGLRWRQCRRRRSTGQAEAAISTTARSNRSRSPPRSTLREAAATIPPRSCEIYQSAAGCALRPASRAGAGRSSRRSGRCSSGLRSPSLTARMARSPSRCAWPARRTSRVSLAIGFGPGGDGHVRFALVENEQRIAQATRSIKRLLL